MLPVITYGLNQSLRQQVLTLIDQSGHVATRVVPVSSPQEAIEIIEDTSGIALYLLGVAAYSQGKTPGALMIGRTAMQRNRFNYTVYFLQDKGDLERVVAVCQRPFSILTLPVNWQNAGRMLASLVEDYAQICQPEKATDYLLVQNNGVQNRLKISTIRYVEALNKKLIIYQDHQVFSVYDSISVMEDKLGERFFRCHRSYLVNTDYIQSVNLPAMELTLSTGERLPIARSNRARAKELLSIREVGA